MAIDEKKLKDDIWKYALTCKNTSFEFARRMSDIEKIIDEQPKLSLENKTSDKWIPFKLRKADDEEREYFGCDEVLDCQLPDEDQEILISYKSGYVGVDTFMYDDGGWYLDSGCEFVTEAVAWMPKPEIYKGEEKNE